jgi:hypothetical protein
VKYSNRNIWELKRLTAAGVLKGMNADRCQEVSSKARVYAVLVRVWTRILLGRIFAGGLLSWVAWFLSGDGWEL